MRIARTLDDKFPHNALHPSDLSESPVWSGAKRAKLLLPKLKVSVAQVLKLSA